MSDSSEQTLSVSGCVITIRAQQAEMCQGDTVGFDITVIGGEKRVIADKISISLQECWEVRRSGGPSASKRRDYDKFFFQASNLTL